MKDSISMRSAVVPVLLCAACFPPQPTPAVVTRMVQRSESRQLIACVVNLNWTEDELREKCGSPDQTVAWAGHDGEKCHLYRTSARSFGTGTGVDVVAACMRTSRLGGDRPIARVAEIFGLESSALPH